MKKLMTLLTGGLLLAAVQLSAQTASAKPVIMTTDGEEIRAAMVELTQSGDFRYAESLKDGSPKLTVRKNRVRWAWVPKPEEITAADKLLTNKKYEEAATAFAAAVKSFGPLGWEPYCKLRQAEALDASGKQSEAIKLLEPLKDYANASPRNEADLSAAYELLIKFYANIKAWDKGLELSKKLMYAGDAAAVSALSHAATSFPPAPPKRTPRTTAATRSTPTRRSACFSRSQAAPPKRRSAPTRR